MKRLAFLLTAIMAVNTNFAKEKDNILTTEDFHLNGQIKSEKTIANGRLLQELKFRPDGRLISKISYSTKTAKKEFETVVTYDANGNVVKYIKHDYTFSIPKKSDLQENEKVVYDTNIKTTLYDFANEYLEKNIVYSESRAYNGKNQETEKEIITYRMNDYTREKYTYEYDDHGLKSKESHTISNLSNGDTTLNETVIYTYNSKGQISEESTYSKETYISKKQRSYFDNGQPEMVTIASGQVCDTIEMYDQKGHLLLKKEFDSIQTNVYKYEYDKKGNLVDEYNTARLLHHTYSKKGIKTETKTFVKKGQNKVQSTPNCITTYDDKGRVVKEAYNNGEYVEISYDDNGYIIIEQCMSNPNKSDFQYGHKVIENKIMDSKDKTRVKESEIYEYDSNGNMIKQISNYMKEHAHIIEYYN